MPTRCGLPIFGSFRVAQVMLPLPASLFMRSSMRSLPEAFFGTSRVSIHGSPPLEVTSNLPSFPARVASSDIDHPAGGCLP